MGGLVSSAYALEVRKRLAGVATAHRVHRELLLCGKVFPEKSDGGESTRQQTTRLCVASLRMRLFHSFLCLFAAHLSAAEVIHHRADASETTKWAARELQRLVLAATGEKLAVVSENTTQAAIRLVADDSLPHDGFVIRAAKDDVVIAGNESTPAGLWSVPSHGTLWGMCEFAERILGVRWLLPGPLGEDVPEQAALRMELKEEIRGQPGLRAVYDALDIRMAAHKKAQPPVYAGSQWELNEEVMKAVHAPLFSAMEQFYHATLAECATDTQKARLALFGDNLAQLHFALRKAGLIADDARSFFHRDDAAFPAFLRQMESTISLYRDSRGIDHGPLWKGEWRAP